MTRVVAHTEFVLEAVENVPPDAESIHQAGLIAASRFGVGWNQGLLIASWSDADAIATKRLHSDGYVSEVDLRPGFKPWQLRWVIPE